MNNVMRSEPGIYEEIDDFLTRQGVNFVAEVGAGDKTFDWSMDAIQLNQEELDLNIKDWKPIGIEPVIVAVEVIEHLHSPYEFMRIAKEHLEPNGFLVFSTPNNDSIKSRLYFLKNKCFPLFWNEYAERTHYNPVFERQVRHFAFDQHWSGLHTVIEEGGTKIFILKND